MMRWNRGVCFSSHIARNELRGLVQEARVNLRDWSLVLVMQAI